MIKGIGYIIILTLQFTSAKAQLKTSSNNITKKPLIKSRTIYSNPFSERDKTKRKTVESFYDSNGHEILKRNFNYFDDTVVIWSYHYNYLLDKHNNIIEQAEINSEDNINFKKYIYYDNDGNIIAEKTYDRKAEILGIDSFWYNKKWNLIKEAFYSFDSSTKHSQKVILYDSKDKKTEERTTFFYNNCKENISYKYNTSDTLIQSIRNVKYNKKSFKTIEITQYQYFPTENRTDEIIMDYETKSRIKSSYYYDKWNNLVKKIDYDSSGAISWQTEYEYEFY